MLAPANEVIEDASVNSNRNQEDHQKKLKKPNTPESIVLHAVIGGLSMYLMFVMFTMLMKLLNMFSINFCEIVIESYVMAHGIRGGVNFLLNLLKVFRKRYHHVSLKKIFF
jgi:hypothetical protein